MTEFDNCFDFYRLSETERKKLVGKCFKEKDRDAIYFPVNLADQQFNYGVKEGVIRVNGIIRRGNKWFSVGAFSPDDLDIGIEFFGGECAHRQDVIDKIKTIGKNKVTYKGVFDTLLCFKNQ